jgi:hypothetical protein
MNGVASSSAARRAAAGSTQVSGRRTCVPIRLPVLALVRASTGRMTPGSAAWPQTRQPDWEDATSRREPGRRRRVRRRRRAPVPVRASSGRMTPGRPMCIAGRRPRGEGAASERVPGPRRVVRRWLRAPAVAPASSYRMRPGPATPDSPSAQAPARRRTGAPPGYMRESLRRRLVRRRRPVRPAARASNAGSAAGLRLARSRHPERRRAWVPLYRW